MISSWMTTSTNSGERSTLPIGGTRRWNTRSNGRVTSKGGTTERALACLEADRVQEAIVRAVKAAAERSRELGDELGRG